MNVQCGRNILHLHPWQAAQLHGSRLESISVFLNLARTCLCHNTPPAVRPRCQLNRGKLAVGVEAAVRRRNCATSPLIALMKATRSDVSDRAGGSIWQSSVRGFENVF